MASLRTPKTRIPYMNMTDCSQGFCRVHCPKWCYIIFPPPPPLEFLDDYSTTNFSPLVIAIIGILASAFLLVSYCTLISKYCGNNNDSARARETQIRHHEELEDDQSPSLHVPWHVATTGLDEALVKSIAVFKYRKGEGLVEGTDCSVCLGEFQEDESIRLLPKCSHAFHVPCIDTWLRSHSNCPLCRANIVFVSASQPELPPPATGSLQVNESLQDTPQASENSAVAQDPERVVILEEEMVQTDGNPKTPFRAFSDLRNLEKRDTIIEIRDDRQEHIRKTVSMDHSSQGHASVADILHMNLHCQVIQVEDFSAGVGSCSKHSGQAIKSVHRSRSVLHCVLSPVTSKRSFSSGRFFPATQGSRVHDKGCPL